MKTPTNILFALILTVGFKAQAQEWQTPVIDGYGRIKDFKDAAEQPDTSATYKILYHISR